MDKELAKCIDCKARRHRLCASGKQWEGRWEGHSPQRRAVTVALSPGAASPWGGGGTRFRSELPSTDHPQE